MSKEIKDVKGIALELAHREAGVEQMTIAQITELVAKISDIIYEQSLEGHSIGNVLLNNGQRRAEKRPAEAGGQSKVESK